jgi:hypothetical protein
MKKASEIKYKYSILGKKNKILFMYLILIYSCMSKGRMLKSKFKKGEYKERKQNGRK